MNPYEELGVQSDATEGEIHTAYRRRAAKTHPDAGGSAEAFARTTTAHQMAIDILDGYDFRREQSMPTSFSYIMGGPTFTATG